MNYCQGLSEYRINYGTLIGQGQQGKVYACEKIGLIGPSLCAKISIVEEQDKAANDKEVEVLKQIQNIQNPNIVRIEKIIYERNSQGKLQLIVIMEKCHTNLKEEMKKTFNEFQIQDFIQQILKGYKCLNEKHIVHRDIKPENILINKLGEQIIYKIADFGTSKVLQEKQNVLQTQIGTPLYAAPEMNKLHSEAIKNELQNDILKCQYNSQPDIFSFGIILSQLVFGESCFKAYENYFKIIELHLELRNKQFIFQQKQMNNPQILKAIPEMLEFLPSKRLTFERISEYFKVNECSQTLRKFNMGMQFPFQQQPKNFQPDQSQQFNQQLRQNQFQPNDGQNKQTIQQQPNKFTLPQQNFDKFQKQPQFSPQIFPPQKNGLEQQSPLKQSLIEDQQKYFKPIIQYLEIQKIQTFQLFCQIITQKLEGAMTFLKKQYTISPWILKDYIKIIQECYPYNCKDNTDLYIRFQFSLFRLSNPGLNQEDPSSIEEMKQIMEKHNQLP